MAFALRSSLLVIWTTGLVALAGLATAQTEIDPPLPIQSDPWPTAKPFPLTEETGFLVDVASGTWGEFMAVWTIPDPVSALRVRARIFSRQGLPLTDEADVNDVEMGYYPAVAGRPSRSYVVVWYGRSGQTYQILGQRFARDGSRIGGEFRISEGLAPAYRNHCLPAVDMSENGIFVVAWTSQSASGDSVVLVRRYAEDGSPLGDAFAVGEGSLARVGADRDGDFAVAFTRREEAGSIVYARAYKKDGTPRREAVRVDRGPGLVPDVDMARNGAFAISWTAIEGDRSAILAKRFTAWGYPTGPRLEVSADVLSRRAPISRLAMDGDGEFVVTYDRDDPGAGGAATLFGRRFNRDRLRLGEEFPVASGVTGGINGSSITSLANGRVHTVWTSSLAPDTVHVLARSFDVWSTRNVRVDLPQGIRVYPPSVVDVSIFGSEGFDTTLVDTRILGLGPNQNPPKPGSLQWIDVDTDGFLDLTFKASTEGIECGEREAAVSGRPVLVFPSFHGTDRFFGLCEIPITIDLNGREASPSETR